MPERSISSIHNPGIKNLIRLRSGRHRRKQGRFLIDGARELQHAVKGNVQIETLFVCDRLLDDNVNSLISPETVQAADVVRVTSALFSRITYGKRNDGVIAIAVNQGHPLDVLDSVPTETQLFVVLAGLEKPGNVGAILRTADAAGAGGIILADSRADLYNPNCIRASMGTVFNLRIAAATSEEALSWLQVRKVQTLAARVDASLNYTEVDFTKPSAIVLGSEDRGLDQTWTAPGILPVHVPMLGIADSLNVSVTAGVLCFEALRQQRKPSSPPAGKGK